MHVQLSHVQLQQSLLGWKQVTQYWHSGTEGDALRM